MNFLDFAEDFSRLIVRYTKTTSISDDQSKDAPKPMTHEEITSIISTVLSALGIKSTDITRVLENSSADSSVNTTVFSTLAPSHRTSTISKQDDSTRRLLASVESTLNSDFSNSCLLSEADETETKTSLNSSRNQDKFVSRSTPIIRVNNIGRSDTFVCEKDQQVTADDDVFETVSNVEANSLNDSFLELFNEIQKSVLELLDKLKKQIYLLLAESLDKLHKNYSSDRVCSNANQKSTSIRTNLPVAMHRSISAHSGTPTTSKLRPVGKENISDRRKSVSNASAIKPEKSNKPAKPIGRSLSNLNLSMCDNVNVSLTSTTKFVKNPKYAHVQSTIPKPIRANNKKA
ncbi:hypothetical protein DMN91_012275 [Ooceraea biroi]|uniref:Uncharacterized protein n=1 Tax=Ooceraea biroi TaxID=2015173 RepID=A0A026VSL7_OOCBI|nr:uncharacterized protein LOC105287193 [Ooceraea biroi]EZA46712.1 hypothetical protein X777_01888 [Ooceraea biroi]RLU15281.1 hypothetical protein DMN91_012275 [Ooceraea biroi]